MMFEDAEVQQQQPETKTCEIGEEPRTVTRTKAVPSSRVDSKCVKKIIFKTCGIIKRKRLEEMKRLESKNYADRVIEEEENKMVKRTASIEEKIEKAQAKASLLN